MKRRRNVTGKSSFVGALMAVCTGGTGCRGIVSAQKLIDESFVLQFCFVLGFNAAISRSSSSVMLGRWRMKCTSCQLPPSFAGSPVPSPHGGEPDAVPNDKEQLTVRHRLRILGRRRSGDLG